MNIKLYTALLTLALATFISTSAFAGDGKGNKKNAKGGKHSQHQTNLFVQKNHPQKFWKPKLQHGAYKYGQPKIYEHPKAYVAPQNRLSADYWYEKTPRLGFTGFMLHSQGLRIDSVVVGSIAEQIGLETGDMITHAGGRRITSLAVYDGALRDAVRYHHGNISLRVRNVRYDWGYPVPQFITVQAHLGGWYGSGVSVSR